MGQNVSRLDAILGIDARTVSGGTDRSVTGTPGGGSRSVGAAVERDGRTDGRSGGLRVDHKRQPCQSEEHTLLAGSLCALNELSSFQTELHISLSIGELVGK